MSTFGYAGLRFPAAMAASLAITGSLFWALWSLTDKTFSVVETVPVKIEFSRLKFDTPPEKKPREKPVLQEPEDMIDIGLPPIDTRATGPTVSVVPNGPLTVELPPPGTTMGANTEAVPMFRVQPIYPPRAAASNTEGWVLVQFDINASGAVTNVVALESEPGATFDKAATDAVSRWRYNPSIVNGQAVERIGVQTLLRFNLEDAE
jgi:protein TonB